MQSSTKLKSIAAVAAIAAFAASPAQADYLFSGSGGSGFLTGTAEGWQFNADGGAAQGSPGNNWGSPGVGAGITNYGRTDTAYGFDITFLDGGAILPGSIATGNAAACAGSTFGGTTFCSLGSQNVIWEAFAIGDHTINFRAQDPLFTLAAGQSYFVNIFFQGDTPTMFEGRWVTDFSPSAVPEPSALALLALGLAGLALSRRKSA